MPQSDPMPQVLPIVLMFWSCAPAEDPPVHLDRTWLVQVRRERWDPRDIDYLLRLEQTAQGWTGRATIDPLLVGRTTVDATDIRLESEHLALTLAGSDGFPPTTLAGPLRPGLWTGTHSWDAFGNPQEGLFVAHPRTVLRFEGVPDARLPDAPDPASTGLDPLLLDRLVLAAEESRSDQLVVVSDGQVVVRRHFGGTDRPMTIQSITKPISALALGMLQSEGRIGTLDTPVSTWFPGFADDARQAITLRHLLTHTSGLDPADTVGLNQAPDRLAFSLDTPATHPPGENSEYNNRAFNLVSGVIRSTAEEEPSSYLGPRLFEPLGIDSATWGTDRAGHESAYVGLSMTATDLAVLGQLLCSDGRWNGQQLIPKAWMDQMFQPSVPAAPRRGLSWALRPEPTLLPPPAPEDEIHVGFGHTGSQGQQIWFHPDVDLVVVRLIDLTDTRWGIQEDRDAMNSLAYMVDGLAQDKRHRTRSP